MSRILYPLAVDLRGKAVLVAGGGAVAARKLTELLRCGADITVLAPEPNPSVERLAGALRLIRRPFKSGDELGRYLVFACTDDSSVNREIAGLCSRGNVLCNVADASHEGTFHVPGVIRKGEVTVTVSTGGAAPGLTRHLKRLLSSTLGDSVAEFAALLGPFRAALREGVPSGLSAEILEALPYRKLLEDLQAHGAAAVERYLADTLAKAKANTKTVGPTTGPDEASALGSAGASDAGSMDAGEEANTGAANALGNSPIIHAVSLVGAGPGHPGLLTVLAAETLRKAEVIIHDRLIPEETLHLAPSDCQLIPAGKRGHTGQSESARQEDIESQLIEHARLGKRVVRLKGGDPFVYGRGWEEVLALESQGIPWTVIPGVSSTTGGPAWAGIPLTHRGIARSYAVMSGMAYSQTNTEVPKADTIVLVMGLHRLTEIVPSFLAQGWTPETPVAAIQNATLPDQRVCISTLAEIQGETARLGFDSPTLLVIGDVVGLAHQIPKADP
jgi:uroporphyrin-III C-methyltransferase / precorrin-2 dehydrogenase / sirohydrochlorin ferrochelatase